MTKTMAPGSTASLTWPIREYGRTVADRGERVEIIYVRGSEATIRVASTETLQIVPITDLEN